MLERITSDPDILGGKPIIKGTRISIEMIHEWLRSGATPEEIVARHPQLTLSDIDQATLFSPTKPHG